MEILGGLFSKEVEDEGDPGDCPMCGGQMDPVAPLKEGNTIKPHRCAGSDNHVLYK